MRAIAEVEDVVIKEEDFAFLWEWGWVFAVVVFVLVLVLVVLVVVLVDVDVVVGFGFGLVDAPSHRFRKTSAHIVKTRRESWEVVRV